jgi:hypothetical protein
MVKRSFMLSCLSFIFSYSATTKLKSIKLGEQSLLLRIVM